MTTGRINQVTDETRRGGSPPGHSHSRRCRSTKATDHPLAGGRSDFDVSQRSAGKATNTLPSYETGLASLKTIHLLATRRRKIAVVKTTRTPAGHHGPRVLAQSTEPTHTDHTPTNGTATPVWGNNVHPNRNSPYTRI